MSTLGDSKALKRLKKKRVERPEWIFKVFKEPAGLVVNHMGDRLSLSERELRQLTTGEVDMARYPMIPKRLYRTFMVRVCEALNVVYRPYMLEAITPPKVPKARIVFPEKMEWDIALKKAEELKGKIGYYREVIAALERFAEAVKEK